MELRQGNTRPVAGSCRSCKHWVSAADVTPAGICMLTLENRMIDEWCADQDGEQTEGDLAGFLLSEAECTICGNVTVYSAWNWGTQWCAYDH